MSTKHELQLMMKTFGYDLNPFTSKDTLINLLRLHSKVRKNTERFRKNCFVFQALERGIDVPKMNDHEFRTSLNEHNIAAGPVIGKWSLFCPYIEV
jgi:hypothetical protein